MRGGCLEYHSVVMSRLTTGAPCHDASGLVDPLNVPIEYPSSVCHLATFSVTVSAVFPATSGLDSAFQAITIPSQTVNGIALLDYPVYEQRSRQRSIMNVTW